MKDKLYYMTVLYKLGITVTEAAERLKCSRPHLSAVINGHIQSDRINWQFEQLALMCDKEEK